MRKLLFSLTLGLLCYVSSLAQINALDIITLKNGSVIKGIIVEQVPNKTIKIQTADGSTFVYAMAEVERIGKEIAQKSYHHSFGQENAVSENRKGYIGFSLGVAFGQAHDSLWETGLNLNLIDFGYLFHENVGIAAKWGGQGYSGIGVGYLVAGPMASFKANKNVSLDAKAMIGFGSFSFGRATSQMQFAYGLEFQTRIHLGNKADFFTFAGYNKMNAYSGISLGLGIAFRLK